jgi:hypothetical protein
MTPRMFSLNLSAGACFIALLCLYAAPLNAQPAYMLQPLDTVAPPLPAICFDATQAPLTTNPELTHWVVFSAPGCAPCKRWLETLNDNRTLLERLGIVVYHVVTGVDSCLDGARSAGRFRGDFPLSVARGNTVARWAIGSTPTTYAVSNGRVRGVVVGLAPFREVLTLSNQSGSVLYDSSPKSETLVTLVPFERGSDEEHIYVWGFMLVVC